MSESALAPSVMRENASQYRSPWWLAGMAMLGNAACANTMLSATLGIFISTLNEDYGWARGATSLSWTSFTLVAFFGTTLVGKAADRLDPGRLAASSMLVFGIGLLLVPYWVRSVTTFWLAYVGLALLGLGTSPVVMTKPVAAAFTRRRGIALGVALAGVGLGMLVLPPLTATLIGAGGWKLGYQGLGLCAVIVAPMLWLALGSTTRRRLSQTSPPQLAAGLSFREAFQSRTFWLLSALSLLGGFGMSGPAAHLVPFLRDLAISRTHAAALASLLGLASIFGRLVTGFTLDRVDRAIPGAVFQAIGAAGALGLALFGVKLVAISVCLVGFVIGSEIALVAYFTSRYFGLRSQATVFGWNYALAALGSATGPVLLGVLRDQQQNYVVGLSVSAASLALAGLICLFLGPYRYGKG